MISILHVISTIAVLLGSPSQVADVDDRAQAVAEGLLSAILAKDRASLSKIANNDRVFDAASLNVLVGTADEPQMLSPGFRSAYSILHGKKVITEVAVRRQGGDVIVHIIYFPDEVARNIAEFRSKSVSGQAIQFRDYIVCEVLIRVQGTFMQNACFAETDVLD